MYGRQYNAATDLQQCPPQPDQTGIHYPMWAESVRADEGGFRFLGMPPYINEAARRADFEDWTKLSYAKTLKVVSQVQSALSSATTQRELKDRQAAFVHAVAIRNMMAVLLGGIDLAITDVANHMGLETPAFAGRTDDGDRHVGLADDHDVGNELDPVQVRGAEGDPGQPRGSRRKRREG